MKKFSSWTSTSRSTTEEPVNWWRCHALGAPLGGSPVSVRIMTLTFHLSLYWRQLAWAGDMKHISRGVRTLAASVQVQDHSSRCLRFGRRPSRSEMSLWREGASNDSWVSEHACVPLSAGFHGNRISFCNPPAPDWRRGRAISRADINSLRRKNVTELALWRRLSARCVREAKAKMEEWGNSERRMIRAQVRVWRTSDLCAVWKEQEWDIRSTNVWAFSTSLKSVRQLHKPRPVGGASTHPRAPVLQNGVMFHNADGPHQGQVGSWPLPFKAVTLLLCGSCFPESKPARLAHESRILG